MTIPANRNRQYMQMCWVVPDLDAAIGHWLQTTGAGPFFLFEDVHFTDSHYRGQPMDVAPHRAAIGQHGDMQIELICPLGDDPGIWREVVPAGSFGFHHTALYCDDYDAERDALMKSGAEIAFEGLMMGARTGYLDTVKTLGFMTELITANPVAEEVFGAFRAAAENWDGSDPIRTLG
ncbi:MAG: VOC family protein [Novosphingobium sp.]|nr:VOC family protein [Novosphingobium sp.]MCP5404143.1 VOC family protein [Novosphingobium sp.]